MFPSNRKFNTGRFTNNGFQPTENNSFVGGTTYKSKNKISWLGYMIIIFVVGMIGISILYNTVPEVNYIINLFL